MNWLFIALASYFLSALAIILDKFILGARKVGSPPVYAFYIGVLGLGALVFLPFGFSIPPVAQIIISIISGSLFTYGILALYFAIRIGQASRVAAFIGAIIPLFAFIISVIFFGEQLNEAEIIGVALLAFGGLLVTFDLPLKTNKKEIFDKIKYGLISGLLLAAAYSIFKIVYANENFLSGFIWTRFGSALAIASFFLVPTWRKDILKSLKGFLKPTHKHYQTGALVILNKIIGGTASILFNYAIALGSVTLINALVAFQYVLILALAVLFAQWYPRIFEEKLYFWDWAQKLGAIVIIGIGIYLVAKPVSIVSF